MILSGQAILDRLQQGQIFKPDTWDPTCIKEASYVLRLAPDGLMFEGDRFEPGERFRGTYIEINPGRIAILSTIELLSMPADLVGKIGIRLKYALQGLTGLMGIQVDPLYGHGVEDERLFIRVANLGNEPLRLSSGDGVFTFELHKVTGDVKLPDPPRASTWDRLQRELANQGDASWSNITQVTHDLENEAWGIREYLQPLVMFGIFLVAVTILGVAIAIILNVGDTPNPIPNYIESWGWIFLMVILGVAALGTAWVGFAAGFRVIWPHRIRGARISRDSGLASKGLTRYISSSTDVPRGQR